MASAYFLTVDEFKSIPLPIKDSMYEKLTDEKIYKEIGIASDHVQDYLDRRIALATYTERLRGSHRDFLILDNWPIVSLTSISSTTNLNVTSSHDTDDFIIDSGAGIIRWLEPAKYRFSRDYWWTVTYTAGYDEIPSPIKKATALQTIEGLQPLFRGGTNFIEVELIEGLNTQIVDLLEKYKNKRIG